MPPASLSVTVVSTTGELGVAETVDITAGLTVGSQEFFIERYQVIIHCRLRTQLYVTTLRCFNLHSMRLSLSWPELQQVKYNLKKPFDPPCKAGLTLLCTIRLPVVCCSDCYIWRCGLWLHLPARLRPAGVHLHRPAGQRRHYRRDHGCGGRYPQG